MRKGIILAGGSGSRLYPLTFAVTKQLLPVHDKPMIYYPLSVLLDLDIKDVLIISTEQDKIQFQNLLGNGSNFGINLSYETQTKPNGIAEGLIIAEKFLSNKSCVFILGDNLFIGSIVKNKFKEELNKKNGATIFTYKVNDPERYGIVSLDMDGNPIKMVEKPQFLFSNNAITGMYFYDQNAVNIAKSLKPSERGELEITDVNKHYLEKKMLKVIPFDDEITWLDAGTINSLYEASNFIKKKKKRTGRKIACLEEIAFINKNINRDQLIKTRIKYGKSDYGLYLDKVISKN